VNQTRLAARIVERDALRYTPAGLPALDLLLEHDSQLQQEHGIRQVKLSLRAQAIGVMAEQLQKAPLGTAFRFSGFLANIRQGQRVILHIQEFQQD
jgi:primosomal replication protein N